MATYDWLTIRPTLGTGNGTVTATIPSHSGYATRSKIVTVSATINGTTTSKSVTFTQTGTSYSGTGSVELGGDAYTQNTITTGQLAQNAGKTLSFKLDGTNAKNIEYYVEFPVGPVTTATVTGILGKPSVNATIRPITGGSAISFDSLTSSTKLSDGICKITYTLPDGDQGLGEHQTYSIEVDSNIEAKYKNNTSKAATITYGMNAIVATGVNMTGSISVPKNSLSVTYPGTTGFDVTGGGDVGASGSTKSISITAPSDVTWTAAIV